jgi:hypothetical protein
MRLPLRWCLGRARVGSSWRAWRSPGRGRHLKERPQQSSSTTRLNRRGVGSSEMESKTSLVEVEDWRTAMAGPGRIIRPNKAHMQNPSFQAHRDRPPFVNTFHFPKLLCNLLMGIWSCKIVAISYITNRWHPRKCVVELIWLRLMHTEFFLRRGQNSSEIVTAKLHVGDCRPVAHVYNSIYLWTVGLLVYFLY